MKACHADGSHARLQVGPRLVGISALGGYLPLGSGRYGRSQILLHVSAPCAGTGKMRMCKKWASVSSVMRAGRGGRWHFPQAPHVAGKTMLAQPRSARCSLNPQQQ